MLLKNNAHLLEFTILGLGLTRDLTCTKKYFSKKI